MKVSILNYYKNSNEYIFTIFPFILFSKDIDGFQIVIGILNFSIGISFKKEK